MEIEILPAEWKEFKEFIKKCEPWSEPLRERGFHADSHKLKKTYESLATASCLVAIRAMEKSFIPKEQHGPRRRMQIIKIDDSEWQKLLKKFKSDLENLSSS